MYSIVYYSQKILRSLNYPSLFFLYAIFLTESILLLGALFRRSMYKSPEQKTVHIIRGLPGAGKKYLVAHLEEFNETEFSICDRNKYFVKNNQFNFKGSELSQAEQFSRIKFLDSIKKGVVNIYVINYFNKLWMYAEYIKIAHAFNYKIKILEIPCTDEAHLQYFTKRSIYNTPVNKSRKCYKNWESDARAIYYQPYIECLPGDCLPKNTTKKILDDQLDDIKANLDKIPETSEEEDYDSDTDVNLFDYSDYINAMDKKTFNNVFKQESSNRKTGGRYNLREDTKYR